jgi:hypothetical protein
LKSFTPKNRCLKRTKNEAKNGSIYRQKKTPTRVDFKKKIKNGEESLRRAEEEEEEGERRGR